VPARDGDHIRIHIVGVVPDGFSNIAWKDDPPDAAVQIARQSV
jgi:hypothetical protein